MKSRTRPSKHDVKKLFGADFKEPTPADYAAAGYVPVDKVLEGLEDKSQPRAELLGQMKQQVKLMKRQLSQLEKQLLRL